MSTTKLLKPDFPTNEPRDYLLAINFLSII